MSTFNTSRIDYFRTKFTDSSTSSGALYLLEPLHSHPNILDLHNEEIEKRIQQAFRFYRGGSNPIYEVINSIESYSILNVPESEVRCYSNGIIEVLISPIVRSNILSPNTRQVKFDNIVGNGRRLNDALLLIRNVFKLEDDIDLHLTLFGVRGCYPYSMASMKLRVDSFTANVVAVPVLQIPMGAQTPLQLLLKRHLLDDDAILTDLF